MKQYLSIPKDISRNLSIYAFDKLDGSNIRAEWSRKHKAFTKFGSRTVLLGEDHPTLGKAIQLVKTKYEIALTEIFLPEGFEEVTCFFEFHGPRSFAGFHNPEDDLTVTLIDVNVYKKGFLFPQEFIKLFKSVDTPALLHVGNVTHEFEQEVRTGVLQGMTFEGVVCKASVSVKKGYPPTMFKIKNKAWIDKVIEFCKGDEKLAATLL